MSTHGLSRREVQQMLQPVEGYHWQNRISIVSLARVTGPTMKRQRRLSGCREETSQIIKIIDPAQSMGFKENKRMKYVNSASSSYHMTISKRSASDLY